MQEGREQDQMNDRAGECIALAAPERSLYVLHMSGISQVISLVGWHILSVTFYLKFYSWSNLAQKWLSHLCKEWFPSMKVCCICVLGCECFNDSLHFYYWWHVSLILKTILPFEPLETSTYCNSIWAEIQNLNHSIIVCRKDILCIENDSP